MKKFILYFRGQKPQAQGYGWSMATQVFRSWKPPRFLRGGASFFVSIAMVMTLFVQYASAERLPEAKDFRIKGINGETVIMKDFKGKKSVFLLFWTTWCPYCRKELKVLSGKSAQLTSANIELLAINIGESSAKVADFLKKNPLNLRVCLDESTFVAESYAVLGIPTYIIVNKDGFIVFTSHSFTDNYLKLISQ